MNWKSVVVTGAVAVGLWLAVGWVLGVFGLTGDVGDAVQVGLVFVGGYVTAKRTGL